VLSSTELVVWEGNRTSFALLQRRITAGTGLLRISRDHPAHYVVFDLLADMDGQVLLDTPLACSRDANRSGNAGQYFNVLNCASEYGLSFDTRGRE
jgi:hypothetical protein